MALKNAVHIKEGKNLQFKVSLGLGLHISHIRASMAHKAELWKFLV